MVSFISALSIIALVALDQIIKYFIVLYLRPIGSKVLVNGFLSLTYVENTGAMMGFMQGKTTFMIVAAIVVLAVLFYLIISNKIKFGFEFCCFIMIAAGGIGNIIDRIFRGFVVDYIEVLFVDFYVFNFADCLVTVGAFLILFYEIYLLFKESKQKRYK